MKNIKETYHLIVNGIPFCQATETNDVKVNEAHIVCEQPSLHEAVRASKKLKKILKDCRIDYVKGRCTKNPVKLSELKKYNNLLKGGVS